MTVIKLLRATLLPAALCVMACSYSSAQVLRYQQASAMDTTWDLVADGLGSPGWGPNPVGAGTAPPQAGEEARVNWGDGTVTLDFDADLFERLLIGVDEGGTVEVQNGGILNVNEDILVGNNGAVEGYLDVLDGGTVNVNRILWVGGNGSMTAAADTFGLLNLEAGGVVNVASHLWWGVVGEGIADIAGTLNQTGGILGLGTINATDGGARGGFATVNILSGGEMNLNNISSAAGTPSIQAGSLIDIQGTGRLTLPGDFVDVLGEYRDANKIVGNGTNGNVTIQIESGAAPSGDYNGDGVVDAADYTVWRDGNSPDNSAAGYQLWVDNFGEATALTTVVTAGLPPVSIPEPTSVVMASLFGTMLLSSRGRRSAC